MKCDVLLWTQEGFNQICKSALILIVVQQDVFGSITWIWSNSFLKENHFLCGVVHIQLVDTIFSSQRYIHERFTSFKYIYIYIYLTFAIAWIQSNISHIINPLACTMCVSVFYFSHVGTLSKTLASWRCVTLHQFIYCLATALINSTATYHSGHTGISKLFNDWPSWFLLIFFEYPAQNSLWK